uniref:Uncharacterized protein n=1 Tax=Lactuca sativa TaxID=4236 RepID=A0A9R1UWP6_LACSA|nr:hypothetical protein LSAT_V11C800425050 [Lactuca sativa]
MYNHCDVTIALGRFRRLVRGSDRANEEFSTVVSPYNDNILPRFDPLDLQKENDYFQTDCLGIIIRTVCKGQTLFLVFCRERILSSILFEDNVAWKFVWMFASVCMLITTSYGVSAPN